MTVGQQIKGVLSRRQLEMRAHSKPPVWVMGVAKDGDDDHEADQKDRRDRHAAAAGDAG